MKIKLGEILGDARCPYMKRWVFDFGLFSIRLHCFDRSDEDRALHDHPWWFFSLLLWGSYQEITPNGTGGFRRMGSITFRKALHKHRVVVLPGRKCVTLVITGPIKRIWGFWDRGLFWRAKDYFNEFGHPPCK